MTTFRVVCAAVLLACGAFPAEASGQNPLARGQQQRPFAGAFQGKDIALELEAAEAGYRGFLTFAGNRYACTASERDGGLHGTFRSGREEFEFRARMQGGQLTLTSGGNEYQLNRREAAAASGQTFLVPGTRLTYEGGSATLQGVRSRLVQDDKGRWVDPTTGKHWSEEATRSSGGMGFTQIDVVHATPSSIGADVRTFLMTDLQNKLVISSAQAVLTGDGQGLGDYWQHPQKLAQLKVGDEQGVRVWRGPYQFGGRTVQAVTVTTTNAVSCTNLTYDQETGLLLVMGSSTTGQQVSTISHTGQVGTGAGAVQQSHARFLGKRRLELPWAAAAMPAWLRRGATLQYQGTYSTQVPGGLPLQPFQLGVAITIDQVQEGFALATVASRLHTDPVQDGKSQRLFGSAMLGGLYVDPKALAALRPEQVIDTDPHTRVRTKFAGVQDGAAILVQESPLETASYAYDLKNGTLTGSSTAQRNQVGTLQIGLRLVNQR